MSRLSWMATRRSCSCDSSRSPASPVPTHFPTGRPLMGLHCPQLPLSPSSVRLSGLKVVWPSQWVVLCHHRSLDFPDFGCNVSFHNSLFYQFQHVFFVLWQGQTRGPISCPHHCFPQNKMALEIIARGSSKVQLVQTGVKVDVLSS